MYVPLLVEKVHVKGIEDLFLVTRIDWNQMKAHVVSLQQKTDLEIDVSFSDISPVARIQSPGPEGWLDASAA